MFPFGNAQSVRWCCSGGDAALMDPSSLLQVQRARGRFLASAANPLRERGTDRAANEGKAKQADG